MNLYQDLHTLGKLAYKSIFVNNIDNTNNINNNNDINNTNKIIKKY